MTDLTGAPPPDPDLDPLTMSTRRNPPAPDPVTCSASAPSS